jgi:hypothetical protein
MRASTLSFAAGREQADLPDWGEEDRMPLGRSFVMKWGA